MIKGWRLVPELVRLREEKQREIVNRSVERMRMEMQIAINNHKRQVAIDNLLKNEPRVYY